MKKRMLFLYEMDKNTDEQIVREHFTKEGELKSVALFDYGFNNNFYKYGFVEFVHKKSLSKVFYIQKKNTLNKQPYRLLNWYHRKQILDFMDYYVPKEEEDLCHPNEDPKYHKHLRSFQAKY